MWYLWPQFFWEGQFKDTHCWDSWREENIWCHLCKHSCSQKQTLRKYISEVHELKKPLKCDQSFSKMGNLTTEKAQKFMKERSHSNVTFVTTVFLKMAVWKYTFYQSVMEIKHSNVTFLTTVFPKKVISRNTLARFMKVRNLLQVICLCNQSHSQNLEKTYFIHPTHWELEFLKNQCSGIQCWDFNSCLF